MIHIKTKNSKETSSEHYGVNHNGSDRILVQLGDQYGEQVRISLEKDEAIMMARRLLYYARQI